MCDGPRTRRKKLIRTLAASARLNCSKKMEQTDGQTPELPVAVARFSSDGVAIGDALPVLWMTSYFHLIGTSGQNRA